MDIALGDGEDLARGSANFDGGEGQDTITGGGRIDGGPGRDHLSSVAGALFPDGDLEPDRFDGSPAGRDGLDFTGREAGVRVDLRRGRTAEGDVFTSDFIDAYVDLKISTEVDPIRLRPHPHEFFLYYDI